MKDKHGFTLRAGVFVHRKRIVLAALLAALIVFIVALRARDGATAASASCATATFDAVGDFSATSNPAGPWSYGWEPSLGGVFTLDAAEDSGTYQGIDLWEGPDNCGVEALRPFVGLNHTGATLNYASGVSQPADMLVLHPSCTGKFSVIRWTAPATGSFEVAGLFEGIDTRGPTTDVHVLQNSTTSLVSVNINGFDAQAPFNFTHYFAAGDTLDFVVGRGSNGTFNEDSTGLSVTITAVPVTVAIPSTAGPWLPSLNPAFDYGVHDNAAPVVIDASSAITFTSGNTLTVTYLSGLVQAMHPTTLTASRTM
jgi:hypothetical protein